MSLAATPEPPCTAVVPTSLRARAADGGWVEEEQYAAAAARMVELAQQQPGFLGIESSRGPDGLGTTTSY